MQTVSIVMQNGPVNGHIEVTHGECRDVRITHGRGVCQNATFEVVSEGPCQVEVTLDDTRVEPGAGATIVTVRRENVASFSFFLRDVTFASPIFIPAYGVAVVPIGDSRSYMDVAADSNARGMITVLQQIESEPEETHEAAAQITRVLKGPTWLGLSRDMRIFSVAYNAKSVFELTPHYPGLPLKLPEAGDKPVTYSCPVGRGTACIEDVTRRLDEGRLPILHTEVVDNHVLYRVTHFVTLEKRGLSASAVEGTHFRVADGYSAGHMLNEPQQQAFDALQDGEVNRDEEPVLCMRVEAINRDRVPRHAWAAAPWQGELSPAWIGEAHPRYDGATGFSTYPTSDGVFCVSRFNGAPMPQAEMAVLLPPGGSFTAEFLLPHRPIRADRAAALATADFDQHLTECRDFWRTKLAAGAAVEVPDRVITEMVQAGLLHLDLVAYGKEPEGTLMPAIGVYCAIGSESSPIIQFFDSMGWHGVAQRAIGYFLEKQHDDGFIQNFNGYMLETGPALWTMGEHYRYTRDDRWVASIAPKLIKACEFMLAWRQRNMSVELRGRGYGLQDGRVADPLIPLHYFMLNGYAYLGMSRVAEMLANTDLHESERWAREAAAFKQDILTALADAMARSPVIPIGDGTWVPPAPAWAEGTGPLTFLAESGHAWTHGTFVAHDSLTGPLYLAFQEVLDPHNPVTGLLQQTFSEVMAVRNVGTSQPFYSRHDYVHLRRGEVKAFLKTYFNGFTGLADRETYSFWEHYFHASPHKTHEEAWFLMQTRWMLWLEEGATLRLLAGIPRVWLEDGKRISLSKVATYFGPLGLEVNSSVDKGIIEARIELKGTRYPEAVVIRLPHPDGLKARGADGGVYDPANETVRIAPFSGDATVTLLY